MKRDYSMGSRFLAYLIDGILIGILGGILARMGIGGSSSTLLSAGNYIGSIASALVYYLAFAYFNEGKTVGKIVLKMDIKTETGAKLEQKELMIRELLKVILMPIALISFIVCLVNDKKQSVHDMIAKTIVIKTN
jgi:uncharacterized RDD family membrane protein YckC